MRSWSRAPQDFVYCAVQQLAQVLQGAAYFYTGVHLDLPRPLALCLLSPTLHMFAEVLGTDDAGLVDPTQYLLIWVRSASLLLGYLEYLKYLSTYLGCMGAAWSGDGDLNFSFVRKCYLCYFACAPCAQSALLSCILLCVEYTGVHGAEWKPVQFVMFFCASSKGTPHKRGPLCRWACLRPTRMGTHVRTAKIGFCPEIVLVPWLHFHPVCITGNLRTKEGQRGDPFWFTGSPWGPMCVGPKVE